MKIENIDLANVTLEQTYLDRLNFHFSTKLSFLGEHKGLRKCCMHTILGRASGGKSTLVRTMIADLVENNPEIKISLWLSEESEMDYLANLWALEKDISKFKNLRVKSEVSIEKDLGKSFGEFIKLECSIFIFDNITTSRLYESLKPQSQSDFISGLKKITNEKNFATICVCHTSSNILRVDSAIDMNNIRGSRTIVNISEYFYIIQNYSNTSILNIVKHRHHSIENKNHDLTFNKQKRLFDINPQAPFSFENESKK